MAFLAEACAGDFTLRGEVESLLRCDARAEYFVEAPALEVAAQLRAEEQAQSMIGRQLGHYQILSLLGVGGMGEVYLAKDTKLARKVALKLLPAEVTQDTGRLRRFIREARAASALNHPNIITIHEVSEADGAHFIVTEFIDGQTLRRRMVGDRLKLNQTLDIATQIAAALAAAHEVGIIHRDIKPENVMVRRDGLVKVLDFGLAKLTEGAGVRVESEAVTLKKAGTAPGMVMGTPQYMSPEQARGEELDARTDLFSFGTMLYEMATGEQPFRGDSLAVIFDAILIGKAL
jgi:serine/threonine protein kinase